MCKEQDCECECDTKAEILSKSTPNWQWYGSNVQLQKRFSLNGGDHHAYIYIV